MTPDESKAVELAKNRGYAPADGWTLNLANSFETLIILGAWLAWSLVSVHDTLPIRTETEECGWMWPVMTALLTIPQAIAAYWWGRRDASNAAGDGRQHKETPHAKE